MRGSSSRKRSKSPGSSSKHSSSSRSGHSRHSKEHKEKREHRERKDYHESHSGSSSSSKQKSKHEQRSKQERIKQERSHRKHKKSSRHKRSQKHKRSREHDSRKKIDKPSKPLVEYDDISSESEVYSPIDNSTSSSPEGGAIGRLTPESDKRPSSRDVSPATAIQLYRKVSKEKLSVGRKNSPHVRNVSPPPQTSRSSRSGRNRSSTPEPPKAYQHRSPSPVPVRQPAPAATRRRRSPSPKRKHSPIYRHSPSPRYHRRSPSPNIGRYRRSPSPRYMRRTPSPVSLPYSRRSPSPMRYRRSRSPSPYGRSRSPYRRGRSPSRSPSYSRHRRQRYSHSRSRSPLPRSRRSPPESPTQRGLAMSPRKTTLLNTSLAAEISKRTKRKGDLTKTDSPKEKEVKKSKTPRKSPTKSVKTEKVVKPAEAPAPKVKEEVISEPQKIEVVTTIKEEPPISLPAPPLPPMPEKPPLPPVPTLPPLPLPPIGPNDEDVFDDDDDIYTPPKKRSKITPTAGKDEYRSLKDLPMPPLPGGITPTSSHLTPKLLKKKRPRLPWAVASESKWGERCVDVFDIISQIGEGTYGQVYKAKDKGTGELVALKKVRTDNEKEGFPITAVREIKILRQLNHPNIVCLREIVTDKEDAMDFRKDKGAFYLVFEYMDHDLMGLLESGLVNFSEDDIKCFMKQLLDGLSYCHKKNFLHRDIKCSNILLNNKGQIKLADFGLARLYHAEDKSRPYTNKVITLWYRPPELLLGEERYGPAIDIWSFGCILGELFTKKPIFQANQEAAQLELISRTCGTPCPAVWPDVIKLPYFNTIKPKKQYRRRLREEFQFLPDPALDLMDEMLTLDPSKRISADKALECPWLKDLDHNRMPTPSLPTWQDCHELWSKKRRRKQGVNEDAVRAPAKVHQGDGAGAAAKTSVDRPTGGDQASQSDAAAGKSGKDHKAPGVAASTSASEASQLHSLIALLRSQPGLNTNQLAQLLNVKVDSSTTQLLENLNMQLLLAAAAAQAQAQTQKAEGEGIDFMATQAALNTALLAVLTKTAELSSSGGAANLPQSQVQNQVQSQIFTEGNRDTTKADISSQRVSSEPSQTGNSNVTASASASMSNLNTTTNVSSSLQPSATTTNTSVPSSSEGVLPGNVQVGTLPPSNSLESGRSRSLSQQSSMEIDPVSETQVDEIEQSTLQPPSPQQLQQQGYTTEGVKAALAQMLASQMMTATSSATTSGSAATSQKETQDQSSSSDTVSSTVSEHSSHQDSASVAATAQPERNTNYQAEQALDDMNGQDSSSNEPPKESLRSKVQKYFNQYKQDVPQQAVAPTQRGRGGGFRGRGRGGRGQRMQGGQQRGKGYGYQGHF
ncbi:cyclin-dependent kinase 12-like [Ptychodera flava]|uniref:cyclin-dependent kinase 12-like n=1 Tax=Ptychodera flava TaxID=63121 RepID=UPI00396A857C